MITKVISFTDAFGVPRTERLYFHFTKTDILDLEFESETPLSEMMEKMKGDVEARDVIRMFKDVVGQAYGIKSPDGKKFLKNERIKEEFLSSEIFGEFMFSLASNPQEMAEFISALVPADMLEDAKKDGRLSQEELDLIEPVVAKQNGISTTPEPKPELSVVNYDALSHEELIQLLKEQDR